MGRLETRRGNAGDSVDDVHAVRLTDRTAAHLHEDAGPGVEIDISVKRRVHRLDNAQIRLAGDGLFQVEAGRAALERSTRPIVLNDHDRVAAPAPRGNQLGDILLGMGTGCCRGR